MMKIVVLDGYTLNPGDLSWSGLEALGDLTVYDRSAYHLSGLDKIIERAKDAEIVFTNKTPIPKEALLHMPQTKFIGVLATGYNIVDVAAANEQGIVVSNIPTYGTTAVAQMVFALLLEMCHHVGAHNDSVKRGDWAASADWCYWHYPLIELAGKTMGIIGYGKIGRMVGDIAQAFGMNVLAYDRFPEKSLQKETMHYVPLNDLLAKSDVISLHCPLFADTEGLINGQAIARMKDGVMLVNTSRGPLVVEEDLAAALNSGKVGGAALDVVATEPIKEDNPLLTAQNCILTPHIAWAPRESRQRLMDIAVNNLKMFLAGSPENVVKP